MRCWTKGILILFLFVFAPLFFGQAEYVFADDVTLAWDPLLNAELAGYKVYIGSSSRSYGSGIDVANVTTYTIEGLGAGTYYFAVTAYDTQGFESGYSNEVSSTIPAPDTTPPSIYNVTVSILTATSASISWTTSQSADSQVEFGVSVSYGSLTSHNPSMRTDHMQRVGGLVPDTLYHYRVRSIDGAGNLELSGDFVFITLSSPSPSDLSF